MEAVVDVLLIEEIPIKLYSLNRLLQEVKIYIIPVKNVATGSKKVSFPRIWNVEKSGNKKYPTINRTDRILDKITVIMIVVSNRDLACSSVSATTIDPSYFNVIPTEKRETNEKNKPNKPRSSGEYNLVIMGVEIIEIA